MDNRKYMKAIQYREDGRFYGFYKPQEPKIDDDFEGCGGSPMEHMEEMYDREFYTNLSAGKEIINPEVLPIHKQWTGELQKLYLKYHGLLKPGDIFDCPDNIEFEEDHFCAYHNLNCSYCGTCAGSCYKPKKVIRLKLKEEVKTEEENALKLLAALQVKEESQNELWNEVAITFMNKYSKPAIEENKSKFTIQRNKNGNE